MKRVVLIEVLLLLSFCVLLSFTIIFLHSAAVRFDTASIAGDDKSFWLEIAYENFSYGFPCLVGALSNLTAMILIAIKDFKVFEPLRNKYSDKRNARKSVRLAAKQAKADADKQKEIAELEAKLNELKKDE